MRSNNHKKIKITFAIPTMSAGGSERVFSFLAKNIDSTLFSATLLVVGKSSEVAFDLGGVKTVFFEKDRALNSIRPLIKYIRNEKPDIVVSVSGQLNSIVAYISHLFPRTKFIAREATLLALDHDFGEIKKKKSLFLYISKFRFNFFDRIICQSEDMQTDLKNNFKVDPRKLIIINNPITCNGEVKEKTEIDELRLISVARLSREKGIERLLTMLSKLSVPFHYTIIGDGPERHLILQQINELGLEHKVSNIPFTDNVARYLKQHDYFLQGSYFEGFPNAVLESCVVGTPVLAFESPGGTKEIIENHINGYIVKDEAEFLSKLQEKRNWDPQEVSRSVKSKFDSRKILSLYEQLFIQTLNYKKT